MAIDTENDRRSVPHAIPVHTIPRPDSGLNADDRRHVSGVYRDEQVNVTSVRKKVRGDLAHSSRERLIN